jgi:hypothetical protein
MRFDASCYQPSQTSRRVTILALNMSCLSLRYPCISDELWQKTDKGHRTIPAREVLLLRIQEVFGCNIDWVTRCPDLGFSSLSGSLSEQRQDITLK